MSDTQIDMLQGVLTSVALKAPVACATTGPITLSGPQTVDGVPLTATIPPLRVLVKDQVDTSLNGIYDVISGAWPRSLDFNGAYDVVTGTLVSVVGGTVNSNLMFALTTANPVVIGTSAIVFKVYSLPTSSANILAVETIATMVALGAASANYPNLYVKNYATSGDGGGGYFLWDATSTATPNLGTIFAATGVTTGRWLRQYLDLELKFFGVPIGGYADTAWAAAVAYAVSAGQTLFVSSQTTTLPIGYYHFLHNITKPPGLAVIASPSSGGAGSNTVFDFTDDADGGYAFSSIGPDGYGTYTPSNDLQGILMLGNRDGVGLNAHVAGLYSSRIGRGKLRDMGINFFNGPGIFWGSTILCEWHDIFVFGCGNSSFGEVEIDGEKVSSTEYVGTTMSIYGSYFGSDDGNGALAALMVDSYQNIDMYGGALESAGLLLRAGSKSRATAGVFGLRLHGVDYESPSNGATSIATWGTGWTGVAGRGIVQCGFDGGALLPNAASSTSLVIIKESTGFFANDTFLQSVTNGTVCFDFQGSHNYKQHLGVNDTALIAPATFTYVKVNGSAALDAFPDMPWYVLGTLLEKTVAFGSSVALTVSGTSYDITSQALTAGVWQLWGEIGFSVGGGTTVTNISAWINTTSATAPTAPGSGTFLASNNAGVSAGVNPGVFPLGMMQIDVPVSATAYLSAKATFAGGTAAAYCYLAARRIG